MKRNTVNGRVIMIADFLFADITRKRADVLKEFHQKFGCTERTMSRLIYEAREYNKQKVREIEAAKLSAFKEVAVKQAREDQADRDEVLTTLTKVMRGIGKKVDGDVYVPNFTNIINAAKEISLMQGFYETQKDDAQRMIVKINMGLSNDDREVETVIIEE